MTKEREPSGLYQSRAHWILPVGDEVIEQVIVDFCFGLEVGSYLGVRISTPFTITQGGTTVRYDPSDTRSLGDLVVLHQAKVKAASVRMDGVFKLEFADGRVLRVEPDDRYEAFHITSNLPPVQRCFEFIALPGGGLARF